MAPRAFISFEMEDRWARDFLVQHARDKRNDIEFQDYSVQDPWDSGWKTKCKDRIAQTNGTIVMIGATTYASDAVLWEIAESKRQGHPVFGVQIHSDETHPLPSGLTAYDVVRWDFDAIVTRLAEWT